MVQLQAARRGLAHARSDAPAFPKCEDMETPYQFMVACDLVSNTVDVGSGGGGDLEDVRHLANIAEKQGDADAAPRYRYQEHANYAAGPASRHMLRNHWLVIAAVVQAVADPSAHPALDRMPFR